jgi:hypothetical protein
MKEDIMIVKITVTYLGKSAELAVDFDDELLTDESYKIGRVQNMDTILNHFFDNVQIDVEVEK